MAGNLGRRIYLNEMLIDKISRNKAYDDGSIDDALNRYLVLKFKIEKNEVLKKDLQLEIDEAKKKKEKEISEIKLRSGSVYLTIKKRIDDTKEKIQGIIMEPSGDTSADKTRIANLRSFMKNEQALLDEELERIKNDDVGMGSVKVLEDSLKELEVTPQEYVDYNKLKEFFNGVYQFDEETFKQCNDYLYSCFNEMYQKAKSFIRKEESKYNIIISNYMKLIDRSTYSYDDPNFVKYLRYIKRKILLASNLTYNPVINPDTVGEKKEKKPQDVPVPVENSFRVPQQSDRDMREMVPNRIERERFERIEVPVNCKDGNCKDAQVHLKQQDGVPKPDDIRRQDEVRMPGLQRPDLIRPGDIKRLDPPKPGNLDALLNNINNRRPPPDPPGVAILAENKRLNPIISYNKIANDELNQVSVIEDDIKKALPEAIEKALSKTAIRSLESDVQKEKVALNEIDLSKQLSEALAQAIPETLSKVIPNQIDNNTGNYPGVPKLSVNDIPDNLSKSLGEALANNPKRASAKKSLRETSAQKAAEEAQKQKSVSLKESVPAAQKQPSSLPTTSESKASAASTVPKSPKSSPPVRAKTIGGKKKLSFAEKIGRMNKLENKKSKRKEIMREVSIPIRSLQNAQNIQQSQYVKPTPSKTTMFGGNIMPLSENKMIDKNKEEQNMKNSSYTLSNKQQDAQVYVDFLSEWKYSYSDAYERVSDQLTVLNNNVKKIELSKSELITTLRKDTISKETLNDIKNFDAISSINFKIDSSIADFIKENDKFASDIKTNTRIGKNISQYDKNSLIDASKRLTNVLRKKERQTKDINNISTDLSSITRELSSLNEYVKKYIGYEEEYRDQKEREARRNKYDRYTRREDEIKNKKKKVDQYEESVKDKKDSILKRLNALQLPTNINVNDISGPKSEIIKILDKYLKVVGRKLKPTMSRTVGVEADDSQISDSKFNRVWNKYIDDLNNDEKIIEQSQDKFFSSVRSNNLDPAVVLKPTRDDKIFFVAIIFIVRQIALAIIETCIDKGLITSLYYSLIFYLVVYTAIFIIIVIIVNVDDYKLRIIFNYFNMHINQTGLIGHIFMVVGFTMIMYLLVYYMNTDIHKTDRKTINQLEKINIIYRLQLMTISVFTFVCISQLII